ncbi:MAG TPA: HYR domain-containing protein, partial [Saprospiraceae bacterium]|nr:HYR domain-containing protein [Saprospiraceae bacterium]
MTVSMVGDTSQCTDGDFTMYVITLSGDTLPDATVTGAQIGMTLIASVYDNNSGNSCWSYITVQDKLRPQIDCQCTPVTNLPGALTELDPSFNNSVACWDFGAGVPPIGVHHYDTWHFRIAQAGMYTFDFTGTIGDAEGAIFNGSFNPLAPCANMIGGDDDNNNPGGGNLDPLIIITLNLVPGDYYLVTTTWAPGQVGTYNWAISGPAEVFNADEPCFKRCTDIDPSHPKPIVTDNCDPNPQPILIDEEIEVLCHPQFVKKLTRTWTAVDSHGNHADTCIQVFYLERINFADVVWPDTFSVAHGNAFVCDGNFTDEDGDHIPDAVPVIDGGAGVPTVNGVPIFPDFMFYCNSSVSFQDVPIHNPNSCVKKVMRIWTLNEWHCQGERDTLYAQLIEVVDNKGPNIICPLGFTHTTNGNDCHANIWIPSATVSDNCSDPVTVTVTYPGGFSNQNGQFYANLPVGNNIIEYTAYDRCYNSSTCTMVIVVQDLTPPVAICDEHTVVALTLGGPHGLTQVPAEVFDDGSYDACAPITFKAWRMDSCIDFDWTTDGAGIDNTPNNYLDSRDRGTVPRTKVPFACCDAGAGPIQVVLQVTDASGNSNTCMVFVEVQDKIRPNITCPSDVTISCDYPLDVNNMSAFGNVVRDQHQVQTWCVYDPTNPYANHQGFICGTDGLVTDNCDVDVTVTTYPNINQCGVGYVDRVWVARDANGSGSCTQRIWVVNFHPITTDAIDWPDDFHGLECALGTDPEDLSYPYDKPRVNEDQCDLIGITYQDLVFPIVDGACFK